MDRLQGEKGVCGQTADCRLASSGLHFGEEPSFSGRRGSGTLFFSGCACRCFFCQNVQISQGRTGTLVSSRELYAAAVRLIEQGAQNLNFVTPDHFAPHVRRLCEDVRSSGYRVPFLCNCSGYESNDVLDLLLDPIDIWVPDFKFADPRLAHRCIGDERYASIALAALHRMVEAAGFLEPWDPSGEKTAERGVLVRHLVLPGHAEDSVAVLKRLRHEFGPYLPLSLMSQYHPMPGCEEEFAATLRASAYARVCEAAANLGFKQVYVQQDGGDDAFLPDFDLEQPFAGNR